MILTQLPDLPPRPLTAGNAEFRRRFYERWGRENAIVCGRARHAEYAEHPQTLSLKMAGGGRERYLLPRRDVVVDDDTYLVLDEGARYGSVLRAADASARGAPAWTFAIFLRPGLPAEVAAARARPIGAALDDAASGAAAPAPAPAFAPHLRTHGDAVSAGLRAIARAVAAGEREALWLEEQGVALLAALLAAEARAGSRGDSARVEGRGVPRAAQRAELRRRLHFAADFMHAHHAEPLTLDRLAGVACLSRYHFVREFAREFGLSPHAWLVRKRARAAWRALARGETDRDALALRCGFGSRWSLSRALARHAAPADLSLA